MIINLYKILRIAQERHEEGEEERLPSKKEEKEGDFEIGGESDENSEEDEESSPVTPSRPPVSLLFDENGEYSKPYEDGSGNLRGINDLSKWGTKL